jgi:thiamine-monophosphate kinase
MAERFTVHAAIDISDGLSLDCSRMMTASKAGCLLDLAAVPIHADAVTMSRRQNDGRTPLDHALADGEDFELLLAMPPEEARQLLASPPAGLAPAIIGEVIAEPGLFAHGASGAKQPLPPQGFVHDFGG